MFDRKFHKDLTKSCLVNFGQS